MRDMTPGNQTFWSCLTKSYETLLINRNLDKDFFTKYEDKLNLIWIEHTDLSVSSLRRDLMRNTLLNI